MNPLQPTTVNQSNTYHMDTHDIVGVTLGVVYVIVYAYLLIKHRSDKH